ncbi:MAG: glycosyltransferase [Candidatus Lernaella stagnicola]|nr:glycosyltransferase [Candidatus Lernaella stagnicola]
MPRISAIVATRDRPEWAREAVASIAAQTYPPMEIIVADDGDGRTGTQLAAEFDATAIHTQGVGPARARHAAIERAGGDWLAFCDDDDTWHPERLARQVEIIEAATALVYSDAQRSDGHLEFTHRNPSAGRVFGSLLLDNWIPTSTVLLRREVYDRAGGFDDRYVPAEDYALWLAVSRLGRFARVDEPLATYRIHEAQLQSDRAAMAKATADVVEDALRHIGWRAQQIPNLAMRLRQLRFMQGRALAAQSDYAAARKAYAQAWAHQRAYLKAPIFFALSYFRM